MKDDKKNTELDKKHQLRFQELVDEAKRNGINREMIGEACGMSGNGVTQYYGGNRPLGFDAALKFSVFFNVPTVQLYTSVVDIVVDPETDRFMELLRRVPESNREKLRQMLLGLGAHK